MRRLNRTIMLLLSATSLLLHAAFALPALPDPASLEPSLLFPSAGASQAQPTAASTIPAFPEQSEAAATSSVCQLTPSAPLLPAVIASCNRRDYRRLGPGGVCPASPPLLLGLLGAEIRRGVGARFQSDVILSSSDNE